MLAPNEETFTFSDVVKNRNGGYQAMVDGVVMAIPEDERNRHYRKLRKWLDDGGTYTDEPPPPAPPTEEEQVTERMSKDPLVKALVKLWADDKGLTVAQVRQALKERMR